MPEFTQDPLFVTKETDEEGDEQEVHGVRFVYVQGHWRKQAHKAKKAPVKKDPASVEGVL